MDRAPLPPHERPWRHPSELGAPEHEPTTTGGKALIVTTATFSLLLIGVLAIAMTPDRSTAPESAASTISGLRTAPATLERPALPMVTPLGDGAWAVTTRSALAGRTGIVQARLPSGTVVDVEIGATDAGVTVVSLPASAGDGYQLAATPPAPSDTVLVDADPPVVVTMDELAALDVDEATPILDAGGHLVGLCTRERDRISVRTVSTMPGDADEVPTTRPTTSATSVVTPPPTRPTVPATTTTTIVATTTTTTGTGTAPSSTGPSTTVTATGAVSDGAAATTAPR